jgi:hypothetical protein
VICLFIFLTVIFFFLWYWGLNSGPSLEPLHQPYFVIGFLR